MKQMVRFLRAKPGMALLVVGILPWSAAWPQAPGARSAGTGTSSPRPLFDQYCIGCHNAKTLTAGVSLSGIDVANPGGNASVLERVLRKVRSGEMPPAGMPKPDAATLASFTKSLEDTLDRAAAANPNPGRPAVHRLNRAEYSNAIRDVLALDIQPGSLLPVDDSGYGFDNIGDVLSLSPVLLERYISVARLVSRLAVGNTAIKPSVEEFAARTVAAGASLQERNERVSDDLPFDSRGGFAFQYYFPVDGQYTIRVKVNRPGVTPGSAAEPPPFEVRQSIPAGLRTIGVTFLRESAKAEAAVPAGRRGAVAAVAAAGAGGGGRAPMPPAEMDLRLDGVRLQRFQVPQGFAPPQ